MFVEFHRGTALRRSVTPKFQETDALYCRQGIEAEHKPRAGQRRAVSRLPTNLTGPHQATERSRHALGVYGVSYDIDRRADKKCSPADGRAHSPQPETLRYNWHARDSRGDARVGCGIPALPRQPD